MQVSHAFKAPVIKFADGILSMVEEAGEGVYLALPEAVRVELFAVLGQEVSKLLAAHGVEVPTLPAPAAPEAPALTADEQSAAARLAADPSGYFAPPEPTTTSAPAPEAAAAVDGGVQQ